MIPQAAAIMHMHILPVTEAGKYMKINKDVKFITSCILNTAGL